MQNVHGWRCEARKGVEGLARGLAAGHVQLASRSATKASTQAGPFLVLNPTPKRWSLTARCVAAETEELTALREENQNFRGLLRERDATITGLRATQSSFEAELSRQTTELAQQQELLAKHTEEAERSQEKAERYRLELEALQGEAGSSQVPTASGAVVVVDASSPDQALTGSEEISQLETTLRERERELDQLRGMIHGSPASGSPHAQSGLVSPPALTVRVHATSARETELQERIANALEERQNLVLSPANRPNSSRVSSLHDRIGKALEATSPARLSAPAESGPPSVTPSVFDMSPKQTARNRLPEAPGPASDRVRSLYASISSALDH